MRAMLFSKRNAKEILRDPLSYVFTLGIPVIMLIIFQIINNCVSGEETYWFRLEYLAPGITLFSFSFVMLYTTILVSTDKDKTFLSRLYTSPMKTKDFTIGYILPSLVICIGQAVVCYVAAIVISIITGAEISYLGLLLTIPAYLPVMLMFVCFGIMFGSLFSIKSAPGMSSIVISALGFVSGIWMPVETMGSYENVCECLPFYPAIKICRGIVIGQDITDGKIPLYIGIIAAYIVVVFVLSLICFHKKTRSDNK
ncbi:MAG: ABC transporter permease [Oscillospiraceae bacterium]|nr:ABC transporter permease [Oscillospiraceae bacterium]